MGEWTPVEPFGWWRSGLLGLVAAAPVVWAVVGLIGELDADLGGLVVFAVYGPCVVAGAALLGAALMVGVTLERRAERWRLAWMIAAPPLVWLVLAVGAEQGGPMMPVGELRVGWSLVVVLMYAGTGVAFGLGAPRPVRVAAAVLVVAAAPLMIAYDDAAQPRWRRDSYAAAPHVLPEIPGYRPVAARGDGRVLTVSLDGPVALSVTVTRCAPCAVSAQAGRYGVTVVDGTYELAIVPQIGAGSTWTAPAGIRLRPAGVGELAALPLAPSHPYAD
ncbi:hypothetical protein [Dactylosporangium vinaceum]|uniref:Integral membrane protein n=1 Tax=Dactylosporangium vinaceum TaxID=53362 RepID=A0ABV5MRC2_9ACTN|nr:hypothetical protein [Dactylosporangium vinaceum]